MRDHLERVLPSMSRGEQDLDRELVARWRLVARHRVPPRAELLRSGRGDAVGALTVALVGGDESVALEPVERRVDLADVDRPDTAGRGLEAGLQLVPVRRFPVEQGQQALANTHPPSSVCILSMHTEERRQGVSRLCLDPAAQRIESRCRQQRLLHEVGWWREAAEQVFDDAGAGDRIAVAQVATDHLHADRDAGPVRPIGGTAEG